MSRRYRDLALLLVLSLCAGSGIAGESEGYLIQAGDVLIVSVWKEAELSSEALVRPDGGISMPLAGNLAAAGHTVDEVRATVEDRLRKYIPAPAVTVAVKHIGGNRIYVLGKVNRPGEFEFSQPIDVMQALSLAGGATSFAAVDEIHILRRVQGRQIALRFKYGEVEKGRALEQNILLNSGDTVVVP